MICLGTAVRNATMWYAVERQVSPRCRQQLRVEEVAMVRLLMLGHSPTGKCSEPWFACHFSGCADISKLFLPDCNITMGPDVSVHTGSPLRSFAASSYILHALTRQLTLLRENTTSRSLLAEQMQWVASVINLYFIHNRTKRNIKRVYLMAATCLWSTKGSSSAERFKQVLEQHLLHPDMFFKEGLLLCMMCGRPTAAGALYVVIVFLHTHAPVHRAATTASK